MHSESMQCGQEGSHAGKKGRAFDGHCVEQDWSRMVRRRARQGTTTFLLDSQRGGGERERSRPCVSARALARRPNMFSGQTGWSTGSIRHSQTGVASGAEQTQPMKFTHLSKCE